MDDAISLAKSLLSERLNNAGNNQSTTASPVEDSPQSGELPQQGSLRGGQGVLYPQGAQDDQSPLEGLPTKVSIPRTGETITATHDPRIRAIAADYMQASGQQYSPPRKYVKVDPDRGKRIADEYESMEHDPYHPLVKASYDALAEETIAQYNHAKAAGLKLNFWNPDEMEDPYAASPRLMTEDVRKNHHMYVFPTDYGYGNEPISDRDREENPMLRDTGETWNGKPVLVNDMFRAIHDYFGHAKEGVGFRGDGEENAWRSHASMYSPLARLALGTETRGQNSWLNYGPHGEKNRTASTEETVFALPKIGLMPSWVHHEGGEDFTLPEHIEEMRKIHKRYGKADGGIVGDPDADEGITAYHGSPHDFEQFDISKIGTGEGNQSYGHGLYFAESEPVAKGYRDKLSEGTYKTDAGEIFDPYKNLEHMNVRVAAYKGIDPAIERATGLLQDNPNDDRIHRDMEKLQTMKAQNATPHKGHMYEVGINAHPDHFLDWDKPFHEQSDHVQQALMSVPNFEDMGHYKSGMKMGALIDKGLIPHTYDKASPEFSKAYHAAGIKGVKYLDAGSRVAFKAPTSNYVVFDDKLVNVKRKYAEGGAVDEIPDSWEDAFHATHADVRQFDLSKAGSGTTVGGGKAERAVFLTSDPENAKTYLGGQFVNRENAPHTEEMPYGVGRHYEYGANIMPLRVNTKDFHEWDYGGNLYDANHMKEMIRQAKKDKAPGIKIENIKDQGYMGLGSGKKTTTYVVLDTSRLRSRFAKFDPKAAKKKDLGAKNGGSIVQRALMLTSKKA